MSCNQVLRVSVLGWLPFALALPLGNAVRASAPQSAAVHPNSLPHIRFSSFPSTSGAITAPSIGSGVTPSIGIAPTATTYPSDGQLHVPQPGSYIPGGGAGTSGHIPIYRPQSDFEFPIWALALYQEYIELDLFHDGLARFSNADFTAAGLTAEDRYLIQFMADQEVGYATMLTNILGPSARKQCIYNYPYATVQEYVDFCQLASVKPRESATLLLQSITTEAQQQMVFRQFEGPFPMPVWFEVGVPQSWAWTLLAPYISSCPPHQTRLAWQDFSSLYIINQPNPIRTMLTPTSPRRTSVISPTRWVLVANSPSLATGHSCSLTLVAAQLDRTTAISRQQRPEPRTFVGWVSQRNLTYSPLTVSGNGRQGTTIQPRMSTYDGDPAINGTMFVAITDSVLYLTPFNLSMSNPHVVAGPALYQAG
ncbi:hypothetical protein BJX96DRAFT_186320 [Aspergillus floccosus]